jgi:hypothetical protein
MNAHPGPRAGGPEKINVFEISSCSRLTRA